MNDAANTKPAAKHTNRSTNGQYARTSKEAEAAMAAAMAAGTALIQRSKRGDEPMPEEWDANAAAFEACATLWTALGKSGRRHAFTCENNARGARFSAKVARGEEKR